MKAAACWEIMGWVAFCLTLWLFVRNEWLQMFDALQASLICHLMAKDQRPK